MISGTDLARKRLHIGPAEPERLGVRTIGRGHLLGQLRGRDCLPRGGRVDLVVHVGDVDGQPHGQAE